MSGTAGVGKTTLAVYWAHRVADRFPDGQLYVDLRGFDATGTVVTAVEAVRGFLEALEVPPSGSPPTCPRRWASIAACSPAVGCCCCSTTPATPTRSGPCWSAVRAASSWSPAVTGSPA
ncbi:hypothetical protein NKG94_18125 [Micromonospora sp. M12]